MVNKDSDLDSIPDWEEGLWGTDPTKKDTDGDGTGDDVEIENLKKQSVQSEGLSKSPAPLPESTEDLTETDKFSRELFATIATLNQNGAMDQATVDKLSTSLADHMQNSAPRKVFIISNIKLLNDNTPLAVENYATILENIFIKHNIKASIPDILSQSFTSDGDIDVKALNKLDPIIKHAKGIVDEMVVLAVPQSLALLHLNTINGFQKFAENLSDIKLIDADIVVAISAISQYPTSSDELESSINKLIFAINQILNN